MLKVSSSYTVMALTATAPICTARGDMLDQRDGFIGKLTIAKPERKVPVSADDEDEKSESTAVPQRRRMLVCVGKCAGIPVDRDTGYVGLREILAHINYNCTDEDAELKQAVTRWFKMPTSVAIANSLFRRDRGISMFAHKTDAELDFFAHPAQLLANVEVGASTRTWLVSLAAFVSSMQILKTFEQSPRDFVNIEEHIELLRMRIELLNSDLAERLVQSALAKTPPPYADFNYHSVGQDIANRLSLLARADLASLEFIQKRHNKKRKVPSATPGDVATLEIALEQLDFLKVVAQSKGDLWFEGSAHTYNLGTRSGAIVVFPSGYLYSVVGSEGMSSQDLMKDRTALSRMESSVITCLPWQFSGYSGDMGVLAQMEAVKRGKKTAAKVDHEAARAAIANFTLRLTTSMILDPMILNMQPRKGSKKLALPIPAVPTPPAPAKIKIQPPRIPTPVPEDEDEEDEETQEPEEEE